MATLSSPLAEAAVVADAVDVDVEPAVASASSSEVVESP